MQRNVNITVTIVLGKIRMIIFIVVLIMMMVLRKVVYFFFNSHIIIFLFNSAIITIIFPSSDFKIFRDCLNSPSLCSFIRYRSCFPFVCIFLFLVASYFFLYDGK